MGKDHKSKVTAIQQMGFTQEQAENALLLNQNDQNMAIEYLITTAGQLQTDRGASSISQGSSKNGKQQSRAQTAKQKQRNAYQEEDLNVEDDDEELKIALKQSMIQTARKQEDVGQKYNLSPESAAEIAKFEPINSAEDRLRQERDPVGLKNVGNTCYFNSLIQSYYYLPGFTKKILESQQSLAGKTEQEQQLLLQNCGSDEMQIKRAKASFNLVGNLATLFAQMILANRKYVDPYPVLKSLTDDYGNQIQVGIQRDLSEFNSNFLERIEEGLGEREGGIHPPSSESVNIADCNLLLLKTESSFDMLNGINMGKKVIEEASQSSMVQGFEEAKKNGSGGKQQLSGMVEQKGSSPPKKEEKKVGSQSNTISQFFFGTKLEFLKLVNSQSQDVVSGVEASPVSPLVSLSKQKEIVSTRKEKLGAIHLDIRRNNRIYESWDEAFQDEVQDFIVPPELKKKIGGKQQQRCFQESWILERPQVLFFNLNRVQYDKKEGRAIKLQQYFSFDKVIYADMFLYKNQQRASQIREDIEKMKAQIKQLNAELKSYQNYKNPGQVSLYQQLSNVEGFITQKEYTNFGDMSLIPQADLQKVLSVLTSFKAVVHTKVQELEFQLKQLTKQLDTAFIQQKQCPYYLHSIVVHDGVQADLGHYYTYIYDRASQNWWKFNDHTATIEQEAVVFKEAFGGPQSSKCAYSLIYISQKLATSLDNLPLQQYAFNEQLNQCITPALRKQVYEQNLKFEKELTDYKVEHLAKQIMDKLKIRTEQLNQQVNQFSLVQPSLINFASYLKAQKKPALMRWILLNDCVREDHPAQISLRDLSIDDVVVQGLTRYIGKKFLIMSDSETKQLEIQFNQFKVYQKNSSLATYIMLNLTSDNWKSALEVFLYFKSLREPSLQTAETPAISQLTLAYDALKVFLIDCLLQANISLAKTHNVEEALHKCSSAAIIATLIFESSDLYTKQTLICIERAAQIIKKQISHLYNKDVEKRFKDILIKITKGNLTKDEKLGPQLPNSLKDEIEQYEHQTLDQNQWQEGWTPESLAFRFYNIMIMFKTQFQAALELNSLLLKRQKPLKEDELYSFEQTNLQLDLRKL